MIDEIIKQKPRIVLLNKADMADHHNKKWVKYYQEQNITAIAIDSQTGDGS